VLRLLCSSVVGAVLSGFAFLLLTGQYINDGPVLLSLGGSHGLHSGDMFVIAGWVVAMTALVVLTRGSRRLGHR
jgi:hypothetical protein